APAAAAAQRLAWLYELALDRAGAVWRYTPRPDAVEAGGFTWQSAALEHGPVKLAATGNELTLSADADLPPIRRLLAGQLHEALRLNLYQADLDQGATPVLVWSGICQRAELDGRVAKIKVAAWLDALEQELPTFWFQQQCNYRVFDRATCRLRRDEWAKTGRIASISGRTVSLEGPQLAGLGAHWFAEGWLETGTGETSETALVLDSASALGNSLTVTLAQPLAFAVVGQRVTLLPGCDGLLATCRDKFANLSNFGGHLLPSENLAVSALKPVRKPGAAKK
ncbi:MAG: phage BR0599 family protein, partial [Verrucomicrobiales bacterium]|nr:phage BR0599 family protein [Verrucomicrobiales bacterium]